MADVLIRSFSKILSLLVGPNNVAIDNWTFQMFYKVTPMLFGACVILVCTRQPHQYRKIKTYKNCRMIRKIDPSLQWRRE